jgi:hypothetical protein
MIKLTWLAMIFLSASLFAVAQDAKKSGSGFTPDDNCGILHGRNHAYIFCGPVGWILDTGIMNDQGIFAVFYPKGSSWDEARKHETFMYINVVDMDVKDTVKSRMDADVKDEQEHDPKVIVKPAAKIQIRDRAIPVLDFSLGENNGHEAVAYIGESKVLVMMVISSKNEEFFERDYPSFIQLVKSYVFITSEVTEQ